MMSNKLALNFQHSHTTKIVICSLTFDEIMRQKLLLDTLLLALLALHRILLRCTYIHVCPV